MMSKERLTSGYVWVLKHPNGHLEFGVNSTISRRDVRAKACLAGDTWRHLRSVGYSVVKCRVSEVEEPKEQSITDEAYIRIEARKLAKPVFIRRDGVTITKYALYLEDAVALAKMAKT